MSTVAVRATRESARIAVERHFTASTHDPYAGVKFESRSAKITNPDGSVVFQMDNVEIPASWSKTASDILVAKYFRKGGVPASAADAVANLASSEPKPASSGSEVSARQVVDRIANAIVKAGVQQGYFEAGSDEASALGDELRYLLITQRVAFNSPVWFNAGLYESYGIKGDPAGNWAVDHRTGVATETVDGFSRPQVSACQPYNALVRTERGFEPIGALVETFGARSKGSPTYAWPRVYDGSGQLTRVVAAQANGVKPVFRVRLTDGFSIEATGDHVVCAHDARRVKDFEWKRVDALRPGMVMRVMPHVGNDEQLSSPVSVAMAALAGWLQTDGAVGQYPTEHGNGSLMVEFQTVNQAEFDWVSKHLDAAFPTIHRKVTSVETKDSALDFKRTRLYGEGLRAFVEKFALLTRNPEMKVPDVLWSASVDEVCAYLKSVFQADGYVDLRETGARIAVSKCSPKLMEGVQLLLVRLGIYSRLTLKEEKREDRYDQWEVSVGQLSERQTFADKIGFIAPNKQKKLDWSLDFDGKACPDVRFVEIESIDAIGEMEVYDIQTESGHYLSNSVLVHNCFIRTVRDDLTQIGLGIAEEMRIFKYGSGAGANFSTLRGKNEKLSGGGTSSGVMSFLKVYDVSAGSVKSGGTTRRAAKMVVLNADHPDIEDFIGWKAREEDKVAALVKAGYSSDFNGEAYATVSGQNANNSVRVTDEFMQAALNDGEWQTKWRTTGKVAKTLKAKKLLRQIAEACHRCADPGMQFDTTCNKWNTVPETGRINATNPCSEFSFLDDTACNLASVNLVKYLLNDGTFDIAAFEHTCRVFILAMDILVDLASYPTKSFAENSHQLRPLGLGYANLGALLMRLGVPYDSPDGLSICAAITSLMASTAWDRSAEIASTKGPFKAFAHNRLHTLRIARMHAAEGKKWKHGNFAMPIAAAASGIWDNAVTAGEMFGYRNAQLTLLAPTGTIGLTMDCDTTGVEPDFALVKIKKLAGGGTMKIVNQSVEPALKRLGYASDVRDKILAHIEATETIEGSGHLFDNHLAVFDCAAQCGKTGQRYIAPMAHLRMMAAAQPFLCGAISKTVNLPASATVDEIEGLYVEGWRLGLKAVAIYRDGSKGCQVLTSSSAAPALAPAAVEPHPTPVPGAPVLSPPPLPARRRLPKKRRGFTQEATIGGQKVYLRTGEYDDGKLGEIFVDMAKAGSTIEGLLNTIAILTSLGLQHGVPLDEYVEAFTFTSFEPRGPVTGDERVKNAMSVMDYIFRTLAITYLGRDDLAHVKAGAPVDEKRPKTERYELPPATKNGNGTQRSVPIQALLDRVTNDQARETLKHLMAEKPNARVDITADVPCPNCGNTMMRVATCTTCFTCGTSSGCG